MLRRRVKSNEKCNAVDVSSIDRQWASSSIRCVAVFPTGRSASWVVSVRASLLAKLPRRHEIARGPSTACYSSSFPQAAASVDVSSVATSASREVSAVTRCTTPWSTGVYFHVLCVRRRRRLGLLATSFRPLSAPSPNLHHSPEGSVIRHLCCLTRTDVDSVPTMRQTRQTTRITDSSIWEKKTINVHTSSPQLFNLNFHSKITTIPDCTVHSAHTLLIRTSRSLNLSWDVYVFIF